MRLWFQILVTHEHEECRNWILINFLRFLCSDASGSIQLHHFDFTKLTRSNSHQLDVCTTFEYKLSAGRSQRGSMRIRRNLIVPSTATPLGSIWSGARLTSWCLCGKCLQKPLSVIRIFRCLISLRRVKPLSDRIFASCSVDSDIKVILTREENEPKTWPLLRSGISGTRKLLCCTPWTSILATSLALSGSQVRFHFLKNQILVFGNNFTQAQTS